MSRRISVLVAVAALSVSSFVHAADKSERKSTRQERTQQAQPETAPAAQPEANAQQQDTQTATATAPATLEKVFTATAEGESIETEDGVSAMVGPIEVVVSKIGPDGKPVMACVDNIEAARRFFAAPPETIAPKQKKEQ